MALFFFETGEGRCGIHRAHSKTEAAHEILQDIGRANGVRLLRPATQDDLAWVRGMGGHVPDDFPPKQVRPRLTKRQIAKAARIYLLAIVANGDCGGASTDDETAVMASAIELAKSKLVKMGIHYGDVNTLHQCIAAATAESAQKD